MQRLTPENPKVVWESDVPQGGFETKWLIDIGDGGAIQYYLSGPLSEVFPLGTRIRITAEVVLPDAEVPSGGGIARIAAERKRQVESEGWTPEHDDTHIDGELAEAAACYAAAALYHAQGWDPARVTDSLSYPWPESWKPSTDPIRNLEKAGALIAAEIDRLLRASPRSNVVPPDSPSGPCADAHGRSLPEEVERG